MDFAVLHQEPFESLNPNGRVPVIEDPNTGITLFESGAIIEYLLDNYDKSNTLHSASTPTKYLESQWLHFQTSGQGPYFGQRAWFVFYHPEKNLTSVLDRYGNEIKRVIGVVDNHLKKTKGQWLVGEKASYADLAWVPWFWLLPAIMGDGWEKEWQSSYPEAWAWYQRLQERPAVKSAFEARQKAMGQ